MCGLLFPLNHLFFGACLSNAVIKVFSNSSYEFLQSNKALLRSSSKFQKKSSYILYSLVALA